MRYALVVLWSTRFGVAIDTGLRFASRDACYAAGEALGRIRPEFGHLSVVCVDLGPADGVTVVGDLSVPLVEVVA